MQARSATASKLSASFITLEEGFQQFGNDLNKLQVSTSICGRCPLMADCYKQFIELNATAFSKILKKVGYAPSRSQCLQAADISKWDKTSKVRLLGFASLSFG